MTYDTDVITQACHAVVRVVQAANGEPVRPRWEELDEETRAACRRGVEATVRGSTLPEQHRHWADSMAADGWKYGPVKDAIARTHPAMVPYGLLPESERVKDRLVAAVASVLGGLPGGTAVPREAVEALAAEHERTADSLRASAMEDPDEERCARRNASAAAYRASATAIRAALSGEGSLAQEPQPGLAAELDEAMAKLDAVAADCIMLRAELDEEQSGRRRAGLNDLVRDMLQSYPGTAGEQEWRDRAGSLGVRDPDGQPYRAYTGEDM